MSTIASILFILIVIFTMIGVVINDETFINNEFTALGISEEMGISNADLVRAMTQLVDYMEGDADDINVEVTLNGEKVNMFDLDQEAEHMQDVRTIYMTIASYRDVGVLVMLILFLFAAVVDFRKAPQRLAQGYLSGSFVMLLIFGFLGTWAALDFSNFWTFFHQMLFWNDLWLFDATESRMINMLPEDIFAAIIGRVAVYAGAIVAALIILSILALVFASPSYKRRHAAALSRRKARKAALLARRKAKEEAKAAAEKEKRLAEKKARKAALLEHRKAQLEAEQKAAEKERLSKEKAEEKAKKRVAEKAAVSRSKAARQKQKPRPAAGKAASGKRAEPERKSSKKRRGSVEDDTGFLDDDDV